MNAIVKLIQARAIELGFRLHIFKDLKSYLQLVKSFCYSTIDFNSVIEKNPKLWSYF